MKVAFIAVWPDPSPGDSFVRVSSQVIELPATAVAGPVLVMLMSAAEARTVARPVLFSGFGSGVVELTVTELSYCVPDEPGGMWAVRVNVALAPEFMVASVQVTVPPLPGAGAEEQSKAGPLFCIIDTKVMLFGNVSEKLTFAAAVGPAFDMKIVNGTSLSGNAFAGALFIAPRSAEDAPGIVTDAALELFSSFGSNDCFDDTVATFVNVVPDAASEGRCMTKVKLALALSGNVAIEQLMVPPDPAGGFVQLNVGPLFWVLDTKVIPAGSISIRETPAASSGPIFIIVTSNETSLPAAALAGPLFVTRRSA